MWKHKLNCPCNSSIKKQIAIFLPYLKKISNAKTTDKKQQLYKQAPQCFTKFIGHCASAILRGDIELHENQYKKLKKYKTLLLELSDDKKSLKHKINSALKKTGGALPLIPILGSILANIGIPFILDKIKNG
jgi:hypothetical protein